MPSRYDDRDDEFNDLPIRQDPPLSGLDAFFANTNTFVLVLFGLCCGCIPLVLSIVGLAVCTDEKARSNATLLLIVSIVGVVGGTLVRLASQNANHGPRF